MINITDEQLFQIAVNVSLQTALYVFIACTFSNLFAWAFKKYSKDKDV